MYEATTEQTRKINFHPRRGSDGKKEIFLELRRERRKKKFSAQKHDEEDKDKATSAHDE